MESNHFTEAKNRFHVSRETFDRLKSYEQILLKWQSKINLIGPDTMASVWNRHFVDSLQLLPLIPDLKVRMIDMGTGAGFAGMVLAIAGATDMHLLESDGKKISFLKEVARITNTSVNIHHGRIEEIAIEGTELVLSRACSSLANLFSYSSRYVSRETKCLFHKGKNYPQELLDSQSEWLFDYSVHPSVTDAQGGILEVTQLRKRV